MMNAMKKLLNIMLLAALTPAFLACSDDDDNPYAHESTITVVSSDATLSGLPDTATIVVNAPQGITSVKTGSAWATPTYSGSTVSVAVTGNPDLEGRNTLVTIYSGQDSVQVPLSQTGFVFELNTDEIAIGDNAGATDVPMLHSTDVKITSDVDWLSATVGDKTLAVTATANNTGMPRDGMLYLQSNVRTDSIYVVQFDNDKDVVGDYSLNYYNTSRRRWYATPVTIAKGANGGYGMRFNSESYNGWTVPVMLGSSYPSITISNISNIGTYTEGDTEYQALLLITYYNAAGNVYRSSDPDFLAVGEWSYDAEYGESDYQFAIDSDVNTFYQLRVVASTDGTYANQAGTLTNFTYAYLSRTAGDGAKKVPFRAAAKKHPSFIPVE